MEWRSWPPEHTASHEPGAEIVFEHRAGGRIFERTPPGDEIEWGEITEWEPPRRLRYGWHIATDPANATDVEIADGMASRRGLRGRFRMYMPPLLEALGLAEFEHNAKNNRMRAI